MPTSNSATPSSTHIRRQPEPAQHPPVSALAITVDRVPLALRSTRNRPRTAVRRGAAWPAKRPSSCRSWRWSSPVRRRAIPLGVLAAELSCFAARPEASVQRTSSGQAPSPFSTMPGRQPGRRSPVGVQQAVSTHPVPSSGARLSSRLMSGPSGVQSPGFVVRDPAPGHLVSTPPVSSPLVSTPSIRTRPSGPIRRWRWDRPRRHGNPHHGNGSRSLGAAGSSSGSGRRPSRPGRRRRRRGHPWSAGRSMVDPGRVGGGRRPRLDAGLPGQARPACGAPVAGGGARAREEAAARGCRTGRQAAFLGMGGRPRCVVVVAPAAGVDGPRGADGRAGGDGRAAPARPRQRASAPGSLPAAL